MEQRDIIVTPLLIIIIYAIAFLVRSKITDSINRKYFLPALTIRIISAIALGFLYQFYYSGGDTFNFHTHGSRHIWEAIMDSPEIGLKLLFPSDEYVQGTYKYSSMIRFYYDPSSFFVVRLATIFDLITFSSYSATAVLFSVISFGGAWMLFQTFYKQRPELHRWIAFATLFIPSVVFWGSGILKDTLTLAAVGALTYSLSEVLLKSKITIGKLLIIILSIWILFSVKKYILLCFLPAAFFWIYGARLAKLRSVVLKILLLPLVALLLGVSGYYAVILIGKDDPRYSIDKMAVTAKTTAYDIAYWTGKDAGSTYNLGELDGTFSNMLLKFPQAVNVSLFRPYLWEVSNPLMLLSSIESLALLVITLFIFYRAGIKVFKRLKDPTVVFCLVFSIVFGFAVGVSTFNFGTLSRYKIPLLPFYALGLVYLLNYSNKDKKFSALEDTE